MEAKRLNLIQLIELMESPLKEKCLRLYEDYKDKFETAPGSKTKHQAWYGGYLDHVEEVMNIAIRQYEWMNAQRPLHFKLSDALFVLFLHDIEKPFKYTDSSLVLNTDEEKWKFLWYMIVQYELDVNINIEHRNALRYVHGEGNDYDPERRVQQPLATFVHVCDVISARIWFDYPRIEKTNQ